MERPFLLRVELQADGAVGVVGWGGFARPTCGNVAIEVLASAAQAQAMMREATDSGTPRSDAWWSRMEGACGQGLGALWHAVPGLAEAFSTWLSGAGADAVLLVDGDLPGDLPWELLVGPDAAPLEGSGKLVVVRLAGGQPTWTGDAGTAISAWCPTPEEPICKELFTALGSSVQHDSAGGLVLLIAHGRVAKGVAAVELRGGLGGADLVSHVLAGAMRASALVAACICESGHTGGGELDALPGRLLRAGASAILAPVAPLHRDAGLAVVDGLGSEWREGCTIGGAVRAARARVRGLALQTIDGRWHNLRLYVCDPAALVRVVAGALGWARCADPQATALLRRAEGAARTVGAAAVGVEHLASALHGFEPVSPAVARLRSLLPVDRLQKVLDSELTVAGPLPERPLPTPRLAALIGSLPAGFSVEGLLGSVIDDPHHRLHRAARSPLRAAWPGVRARSNPTLQTVFGSAEAGTIPAMVQVVGGPEDGRLIRPNVGDVLGRAQTTEGPDIGLYSSIPLFDARLSRRSLRWEGAGKIELFARGTLLRAGQRQPVEPGPLLLHVGDTLLLTSETRLVVLGGAGG